MTTYFNRNRNRVAFTVRVPYGIFIQLKSISAYEKKSVNQIILDQIRHKCEPPYEDSLHEPFISLLQEFYRDIQAMIYVNQPGEKSVYLILREDRKTRRGLDAKLQAIHLHEPVKVLFLHDPRKPQFAPLYQALWCDFALESKVLYDRGGIEDYLISLRKQMAAGDLHRKTIYDQVRWITRET